MLDLVLALEWVRENIEGFGGDPRNVTIFGESGGGGKVSTLLAMPGAAGLFHRAIVESGPALRVISREKAAERTEQLMKALGLSEGNLNQLQTMPLNRIFKANARVNRNALLGWGPVVDGKVLPQHPFDPAAPAISANVPLIIGTNKDEATLFLLAYSRQRELGRGGGAVSGFSENLWFRRAVPRILKSVVGSSAESLLSVYRQTRPQASPRDLFVALITDWMMRIPSIIQAERKYAQQAAPVFMYLFTWETPVLMGGSSPAMHLKSRSSLVTLSRVCSPATALNASCFLRR